MWWKINFINIKNEYIKQILYTMEAKAVIIQKTWRGYHARKQLRYCSDVINYNDIYEGLKNYITFTSSITKLNAVISERNFAGKHKTIRSANFPEFISENIVKFAIYKHYNVMPLWNVSGDLQIQYKRGVIQIEVKAYSSDGPSSFGPEEAWDKLYFVDCKEYNNYMFKVYEINLSNTSADFRGIVLARNQKIPENYIIPSIDILNKMNVQGLKKQCDELHISKAGSKSTIVDRITHYNPINAKKGHTYGETADKNQRGKLRGSFESVFRPQMEKINKCRLIFDGHYRALDPSWGFGVGGDVDCDAIDANSDIDDNANNTPAYMD
jgi:hypothetical protein